MHRFTSVSSTSSCWVTWALTDDTLSDRGLLSSRTCAIVWIVVDRRGRAAIEFAGRCSPDDPKLDGMEASLLSRVWPCTLPAALPAMLEALSTDDPSGDFS